MHKTNDTDVHKERVVVHVRDGRGLPRIAEPHHPPLEDTLTSPDELFVVHHYDPPPPDFSRHHSIEVHGLVGQVLRLTSASLLADYQLRTVRAVIDCAGTARKFLEPAAPGAQLGNGTCGVAEWSGIRLADVLNAARFDADHAVTAVVEGGDWTFQKGLPIQKALHPDTLLALSINDVPLPHDHGGPVRLVVPGWYGVWWVKWVRRIEVINREFSGYWQHDRYILEWNNGEKEVVTEQAVRSLISAEVAAKSYRVGDAVPIGGWAWSGAGRIDRVEVQVGEEGEWREMKFDPPKHPWDCTRWHGEIPVTNTGEALIRSRAYDTRGSSQPLVARRNRFGYANNQVQGVTLIVEPPAG